MNHRFSSLEEKEQKDKLNQEQAQELEYSEEAMINAQDESQNTTSRIKPEWEDTITNRMLHWNYSEEQKRFLHMALEMRIPKNRILQFYYPETSSEEMKQILEEFS